jgi:glucose dehydrogenase
VRTRLNRIAPLLALVSSCFLAAATPAPARQAGETLWGADDSGTHFSGLAQITPGNIGRLGVAWTYDVGARDVAFEDTPLVVGNRMYLLLPDEAVVALDPDSGRRIWSYDPHVRRTRVSRGISYWRGTGDLAARLVVATTDGRLIELDPRTGKPIVGFADHGVLDLRALQAAGYPGALYGFTSPPAVYRDMLILGPDLQEGPGEGPPGLVTGVSAVTGRIVWTFHTTPQPGQPGNLTWGAGGWKNRSGPAAWGNITVDPRLGLAFIPIANPAASYYGGDRPGTNLYANSVVALDAATGRLRWYYQLVHHDLWDTDIVGTTLVQAWRGGRELPAVAALTKSALLFVLDRRTGKPVFGVYDQPVGQSSVPGERSSATEPYPLEPPPLARQSITGADLSTISPESAAYCRRLFAEFPTDGPYTPFQLEPAAHFPSSIGGANWGGASYDGSTGYVYVNTSDIGMIGRMEKVGPAAGTAHRGASAKFFAHFPPNSYQNAYIGERFVDQRGLPCQQPPWGLLSAVSMRTGRIAWQVRLGDYPDLARAGVPPTGTPNLGGSLVTAGGLVFIGGTLDGAFRAFDAHTGRMLWEVGIDGYGEATPVSYLGRDGRQYIAIAVGGPGLFQTVHHSVENSRVRLIVFMLGGKRLAPLGVPAPADANAGVPWTSSPRESARLPSGPGRQIVQADCTLCHGVENITRSRLSRAQWRATVRDMMSRGAPVTTAEYGALLDYLTDNFGPH